MKDAVKRIAEFLLAGLITGVYFALSRLWRVKHFRRPERIAAGLPYIGAHWHGDELLLVGVFRNTNMAALTSRSRDGQLMTRVLHWLGYRTVRGSSTRGGAAGLKGLIDVVIREGCSASLAVDGPRGPLHKMKPGILKLAQETGHPIVLGAAATSRKYVFKKTWNQCYLPLPFSSCVVVYGPPIFVPAELTELQFEELRLKLERELWALKAEADSQFNPPLLFEPLY